MISTGAESSSAEAAFFLERRVVWRSSIGSYGPWLTQLFTRQLISCVEHSPRATFRFLRQVFMHCRRVCVPFLQSLTHGDQMSFPEFFRHVRSSDLHCFTQAASIGSTQMSQQFWRESRQRSLASCRAAFASARHEARW